jgi:protein-tyrosine phosphatase
MMSRFVVLSVCAGNLNRSALACVLLRTWADWYAPALSRSLDFSSGGLVAPVGAPMEPRAQAIARALGGDGSSHRARELTDQMIRNADLILVASRRQLGSVLQREPSVLRRVFTIPEAGAVADDLPRTHPHSVADLRRVVEQMADRRGAHRRAASMDISDPQGKGDDAYLRMAQEEVVPLTLLAGLLFDMPRAEQAAYQRASAHESLLTGIAPPSERQNISPGGDDEPGGGP